MVSGTIFLAGTDAFDNAGGVFRSSDGGLNWTADATQPAPYIFSLVASGGAVFAGTSAMGIWRSPL